MRRLKISRLAYQERLLSGKPLPGDACDQPGCAGTLHVDNSHQTESGDCQVRSLQCSGCGHRPEDYKWVAPIE